MKTSKYKTSSLATLVSGYYSGAQLGRPPHIQGSIPREKS